MNDEAIIEVLTRVSYRPGWNITVQEHPFEGHTIRIVAPGVEDSYNLGSTIDLGVDSFLPPMSDEASLFDWLLWRLGRIESHECREWFKVDGKPWKDPHVND